MKALFLLRKVDVSSAASYQAYDNISREEAYKKINKGNRPWACALLGIIIILGISVSRVVLASTLVSFTHFLVKISILLLGFLITLILIRFVTIEALWIGIVLVGLLRASRPAALTIATLMTPTGIVLCSNLRIRKYIISCCNLLK